MVVVTSIVSVTVIVPSLTEKMQCPLLCGVTVNCPEPLAGEIVAIPLHELVAPVAGVVAVKFPVKPASDAPNVFAFAAPVAVNAKLLGVSVMAPGLAVALGVGDAVAVGVGDAVADGDGDGDEVRAGVGVGLGAAEETGVAVAAGVGVAVAVGVATAAVPPELLQPIVPAAITTAKPAPQSTVRQIDASGSRWTMETSATGRRKPPPVVI